MIAMILALILAVFSPAKAEIAIVTIPAKPNYAPTNNAENHWAAFNAGCMCDDCYWVECSREAAEEFDALFNSYEVKRAKNGAMMIRRGNSGPYKFARKA